MSEFDVRKCLEYIPVSECTYEEWIQVGMALKTEGYSCADWDNWSMNDSRYKAGNCERKWKSFKRNDCTGATITQMAKDRGWEPSQSYIAYDWEDEIGVDMPFVKKENIEAESLKEPAGDWDQVGEIIEYLELLFQKGDYVGINFDAIFDEDKAKWHPKSSGQYSRTVEELVESLKKWRTKAKDQNDAIASVFGSPNEQSGAWVRFNPLDGKGVRNDNVTDYRYALVECDNKDIGTQIALIRKMEMPVKVLVHSGRKSVHAIVNVNAANYKQYQQRTEQLYEICRRNGLTVDTNNKNPSRLSRLPGVFRDGKKQYIIDRNIGKASWDEWLQYISDLQDDLPDFEDLENQLANPPELAPELIKNILRRGHKGLLAGPSKAGKSFLLMELAICISEGIKWINWECTKGKVLYINLEVDKASCINRFANIYKSMGILHPDSKNIHIWNLRGLAVPMDKLVPKLIRRAKEQNYDCIILDPIYKVITGDENSASEMAKFCNQFDKITNELGCSVIYCHHHSKGAQSGKVSMDRSSGSGVFARDPDAVLDILEMEVTDEIRNQYNNGVNPYVTGWKIEGTLREFPTFEPVYCFFDYPLHKHDSTGLLAKARTGDASRAGKKGNETEKNKKRDKVDELKDYLGQKIGNTFDWGDDKTTKVYVSDAAEYMNCSEKTIKNYVKEIDCYEVIYDRNDGPKGASYIALKK
ncbi:MAG: AAA family ATPase [Dorea sp.]|nr:AAA family ATPase [Dorea sp.]